MKQSLGERPGLRIFQFIIKIMFKKADDTAMDYVNSRKKRLACNRITGVLFCGCRCGGECIGGFYL